jgi:hypothetical protein
MISGELFRISCRTPEGWPGEWFWIQVERSGNRKGLDPAAKKPGPRMHTSYEREETYSLLD